MFYQNNFYKCYNLYFKTCINFASWLYFRLRKSDFRAPVNIGSHEMVSMNEMCGNRNSQCRFPSSEESQKTLTFPEVSNSLRSQRRVTE